jgi:hypothetical protein
VEFIHPEKSPALRGVSSRDLYSPFDVEISPTYISLVLFIHRITGLPQGLYTYIRNEKHLELFKEKFKKDFLWEEIEENLFLYDGR